MPDLETAFTLLLVLAAFGYALGSIPFGVVVTRFLGLGDVRQIGSGNIGATNVLRTGSKGAAAATLLLDGAKGAVAVLIARWFAGEDAAQLAGLAAFVGHLWPVWLGFKGGKGVATFLGTALAVAPWVGLAAMATWFLMAAVSRISSLSALAAAIASPFIAIALGRQDAAVLLFLLCALIYWRHSENIARLRAGTEPRIGGKKRAERE